MLRGRRNPLDVLAEYGELRSYLDAFQSYKLLVGVYNDRRDDEDRFLRLIGNTRLIDVDQTHGFCSRYH